MDFLVGTGGSAPRNLHHLTGRDPYNQSGCNCYIFSGFLSNNFNRRNVTRGDILKQVFTFNGTIFSHQNVCPENGWASFGLCFCGLLINSKREITTIVLCGNCKPGIAQSLFVLIGCRQVTRTECMLQSINPKCCSRRRASTGHRRCHRTPSTRVTRWCERLTTAGAELAS